MKIGIKTRILLLLIGIVVLGSIGNPEGNIWISLCLVVWCIAAMTLMVIVVVRKSEPAWARILFVFVLALWFQGVWEECVRLGFGF